MGRGERAPLEPSCAPAGSTRRDAAKGEAGCVRARQRQRGAWPDRATRGGEPEPGCGRPRPRGAHEVATDVAQLTKLDPDGTLVMFGNSSGQTTAFNVRDIYLDACVRLQGSELFHQPLT